MVNQDYQFLILVYTCLHKQNKWLKEVKIMQNDYTSIILYLRHSLTLHVLSLQKQKLNRSKAPIMIHHCIIMHQLPFHSRAFKYSFILVLLAEVCPPWTKKKQHIARKA